MQGYMNKIHLSSQLPVSDSVRLACDACLSTCRLLPAREIVLHLGLTRELAFSESERLKDTCLCTLKRSFHLSCNLISVAHRFEYFETGRNFIGSSGKG